MTADYNVSAYDLANTFLPGFKEATSNGGAMGFMCSYSSINGVPSWCVRGADPIAYQRHAGLPVVPRPYRLFATLCRVVETRGWRLSSGVMSGVVAMVA
jgi:hypothetical protein